MKRRPRHPKEPVVTRQRAFLMLAQGAFIAFCSLAAFCFVMFIEKEGLPRARTAAFVVLACSQLFHAFNCRSQTESLFKLGVFTNAKLLWAAGLSFLLQMMVVYVPFCQTIFKTEPLMAFDWCMVIAISSLPLWAMELIKAINKQFRFLNPA
jgi:Ca2+-transporting ATPase